MLTDQQKNSDAARTAGQLTPEQWRRDYSERKQELAIRNDQIYSKLNLETKDPVLRQYYASIDSAKGADGKIDWSKVDAYIDAHPDQAEYIKANTGLVKIDTPATQAFKKTFDAIDATGYFDKTDDNWKSVAELVPDWSANNIVANPKDYPSYDAWRADVVRQGLILSGKTAEDVGTVAQIESWLNKQSPVKGMDYFGSQWKDQWVLAHPKEAYEAWRYGYYNPKKEIKEYLAKMFE